MIIGKPQSVATLVSLSIEDEPRLVTMPTGGDCHWCQSCTVSCVMGEIRLLEDNLMLHITVFSSLSSLQMFMSFPRSDVFTAVGLRDIC
jgi:predicted metal-binding protein